MIILISVIICSILCGVIFSTMWASTNTRCVHPDHILIDVIVTPEKSVTELETAVATIMRQFDNMNAVPRMHISVAGLNEADADEAKAIAMKYGAGIIQEKRV